MRAGSRRAIHEAWLLRFAPCFYGALIYLTAFIGSIFIQRGRDVPASVARVGR
ncbi:MAG TPA: hypothetical protein VLN59_05795 [Burkholderiales bacterium]|nr:hypothetical protein [Burkholderiales bacterium]